MKRVKGFTLIEVMIVVAILGILSAIAYPSYVEHVRKTRRAVAAGCLVERSQFMERYYTSRMTYAGAVLPACDAAITAFYNVAFTDAPTAAAYSIDAIPQGAQEADSCGTLSINQAGTKTSTSGAAKCWQ